MTAALQSHLGGRWVDVPGATVPLVDPTTEAVLGHAPSGAPDLAAAVAHARTRGLPALQELSFARRGELLSAMSKALHAHRDELLDLSTTCGGNTRGDAKFDVDGATGTLAFYAKLAAGLGDARFFVDGEGVQLGRSPKFAGEHLLVPRRGVAIHINAFNFPAWGMCEKAALALLAGVPVITKPATSTALLAHRMVELLVEAGALPDGAFQLLLGSAREVFEHLGAQDVVAFTGSSDTAAVLRRHDCFVRRGARLNVEADSLNAAVLGPDVEPGSETFDLFVREVVHDMAQKAGQKCTAIRRVLAPRATLEAAREALVAEVRQVRAGDPRQREVRCGPVASADQLRDVRAGVERLKACARPLVGDGGRGALVGVTDEKGFFVGPTLFEADDAFAAEAVHRHEVFGPVQTLLPYSGEPDEAARIVALGEGGLVSSVYTDDPEVALRTALGLAPWNGRVNVGSAKVAADSLGPGAVLPALVHGGPGRAGGGEELGGLRGLSLYLQRTALQGYKPLLERIGAGGRRT